MGLGPMKSDALNLMLCPISCLNLLKTLAFIHWGKNEDNFIFMSGVKKFNPLRYR